MEPRIQYAQTKDGVSIAFTTVGKGPPLVVAGDISDSHVQLVWNSPPSGPLFKFLAGKHTVVKFDPRGFGLSDRDVSAFSLDSRLLDLEAVVDHLELTRFTILGIVVGGPVALAVAAQHPERVSGLALMGSPVRTADIFGRHRIRRLLPLIQTDWDMFLENLSAVNVGFGRSMRRPYTLIPISERPLHGDGALQGLGRGGEGGHEAVTHRLHLRAAVGLQRLPNHALVLAHQLPGFGVTEALGQRRGPL